MPRLMILAIAFVLSGCAVGGPKAPGPGATTPLAFASSQGVVDDSQGMIVLGHDGEPLRLHMWPAASGAPSLIVVAVHGYGDHATSTYEVAATEWRESGATVYAYDQRGFGRNRSRGAWPGAQALVDDLATVVATIAERHPGAPITLVGHSMGGGVSLIALGEGRLPDVDAAVLLAPAVWGGDAMPNRLRLATWLATAIAPDRRLTGGGLVTVRPTDNDEQLRKLAADPFYLKFPSPREYMGVVRLMDRAVAAAPTTTVPVMVMYGVKDEIIPSHAIDAAVEQLAEPKTYVEYDEGWHLLLRDMQGPQVRQDVIKWAMETTNAGTVAAAD